MKIGLFFGSFNPIHYGHLIVANHIAHIKKLDKVWLVISPHNPYKDIDILSEATHRVKMAEIAIEGNDKLFVSDIELSLSKPSYTLNTLTRLKEINKKDEFAIIIGSDTLLSLFTWEDHEQIINEYTIFVYPRPDCVFVFPNIEIMQLPVFKRGIYSKIIFIRNVPELNISSTMIRAECQQGIPIDYLIPEGVIKYIDTHNLYKS